MMKKWFYSVLFMILFEGFMMKSFAQEAITIEQCQKWAMENYPAIQQHDLLEKAREYTLSNISRVYMPEFSLTGVASWQSEKMKLDLKVPDKVNVDLDLGQLLPNSNLSNLTLPVSIPEMSIPISDRDRYNASLSLKQALWAGGKSESRQGDGKNGGRYDARRVGRAIVRDQR